MKTQHPLLLAITALALAIATASAGEAKKALDTFGFKQPLVIPFSKFNGNLTLLGQLKAGTGTLTLQGVPIPGLKPTWSRDTHSSTAVEEEKQIIATARACSHYRRASTMRTK